MFDRTEPLKIGGFDIDYVVYVKCLEIQSC